MEDAKGEMRQRGSRAWLMPGAMGLVIGLYAGISLTSILAARSAQAHLQASRLLFEIEEDLHTGEALRAGDVEQALLHVAAGIEAQHGTAGAEAFGAERSPWTFWFAVREVLRDRKVARRDDALEAMARARLAVLWNALGKADSAERELARAKHLNQGKLTREEWLEFGRSTLVRWCERAEVEPGTAGPIGCRQLFEGVRP